jgi:hypothetical protein
MHTIILHNVPCIPFPAYHCLYTMCISVHAFHSLKTILHSIPCIIGHAYLTLNTIPWIPYPAILHTIPCLQYSAYYTQFTKPCTYNITCHSLKMIPCSRYFRTKPCVECHAYWACHNLFTLQNISCMPHICIRYPSSSPHKHLPHTLKTIINMILCPPFSAW